MGTIFISYRRGDGGWAGRLYQALEGEFATFFDEQIPLGEPWPDYTREAAEECSVMLLVMGPSWVEKQNLQRLHDPDDWVRRELLLALGKKASVRIVPLLFGKVDWPDRSLLPAPLQGLPDLQSRPINHWDSDLAAVVGHLRACLSGRAVGRNARAPFPRILPHLCDRIDQQDTLEDLVADAGGKRVFACVLHGESAEGHDGFVDRLVHQHVFDRLFRAQATGIAVHHLDWSREQARLGRYDMVLLRALRRALESSSPEEVEIGARLLAPGLPRVLVLQVTASDCRACGPGLLDGLIAAWFALFDQPRGQPGHPMVLWINFAYPTPVNDAAAPNLPALEYVLPRLGPVEDGDIREWLTKPEVKMHAAGREGKLLRIAEDGRWRRDDGALAMLSFAEAVEEILGTS